MCLRLVFFPNLCCCRHNVSAGHLFRRQCGRSLLGGWKSERPQNWAWLVVNYRGYGGPRACREVDGCGRTPRIRLDAIAFRFSTTPALSHSGAVWEAGVAIRLASVRPWLGLVLATPFDSLERVAKRHYPFAPVSLLLRHRFDSLDLGAPHRRSDAVHRCGARLNHSRGTCAPAACRVAGRETTGVDRGLRPQRRVRESRVLARDGHFLSRISGIH